MSSWPDVERGKPQSTRSVIPLPAWLALMSAQQVSSTLMFEAIDGRRSISEIVDKVKEKGASPLFFEKLWWYDQVVFDTSKAQ
jgi:hypothetical protein